MPSKTALILRRELATVSKDASRYCSLDSFLASRGNDLATEEPPHARRLYVHR